MNSSGKVLIIFLVIIAILLISLTAISLFFFQKETQNRKLAEATLEEYRSEKITLESELKKIKKQNFLLEEKNKDADERVNDLSDELELEKGLREEMKLEAISLKEKIEKARGDLAAEVKAKEDLQKNLSGGLLASEQKIKELETELQAEVKRGQKLGQLYEQQRQEGASWLKKIEEQQKNSEAKKTIPPKEETSTPEVELGEIVVVQGDAKLKGKAANAALEMSLEETFTVLDKVLDGRILSVDAETEFVIVSLGEKDGLAVGNVLSVYRGEDYMGDIKITRLQPEMSAADLILPLSIRNVKKNDQVKTK